MSTYTFKPRAVEAATVEPTIPVRNMFEAFGSMRKENRYQPDPTLGYRAWKKETEEIKIKNKVVDVNSTEDFPDFMGSKEKKSHDVFGGISLADKLKETIAAEEEAIRRRRLQDDEKEERWIRENCVSLPCKGLKALPNDPEFKYVYHHKDILPIEMPLFYPKSKEEYRFIRQIAVLEQIGADVRALQEENEALAPPDEMMGDDLVDEEIAMAETA